MFMSQPFPFTYQGEPSNMVVCRNDGFCWGTFVAGDKKLDVVTIDDHYDRDDVLAADAFIKASIDPTNVKEALR